MLCYQGSGSLLCLYIYNQRGKHDSHPDGAKQLKYLH